MLRHSLLPLLALSLLSPGLLADGCTGEEPDPPPDDLCLRSPVPGGGARNLVISLPYDADGGQAPNWEVLDIAADGALSRGPTFSMGRAVDGEIAFTPDGEVGIAVQEDGSLGVFKLDADGTPTVIHSQFEGEFYAAQVLMGADGDRAYIADPNWRENGGGIYGVWIHCDGSLSDRGLLTESKLAYQLRPIPGAPNEAFVTARDFSDAPEAYDGYRVGVEDMDTVLQGGDGFGDDDGIFSSAAVTFDGRYGVIGDNNLFSGTGNRLGVVDLQGGGGVQVLTDVEDPVAIAFNPFGGSGIVMSGFGDAILELSYEPGSSSPLRLLGPLPYSGTRPQLPGSLAVVEEGPLQGQVYGIENTAIRRLSFEQDGRVVDLGPYSLGLQLTSIPGAIGIRP